MVVDPIVGATHASPSCDMSWIRGDVKTPWATHASPLRPTSFAIPDARLAP